MINKLISFNWPLLYNESKYVVMNTYKYVLTHTLSLVLSQIPRYNVVATSIPVLREETHNSSWPQLCYVDNNGFELLTLLSMSRLLGVQVCTTIVSFMVN